MPITLTVPPTVVDGARSYAERREREAREMFDYFMSQKGSLVEGYVFSHARQACHSHGDQSEVAAIERTAGGIRG